MYSRGKELVEEDKRKSQEIPSSLVEKSLGSEELSEKARIVEDLLQKLGPLAENRLRQQREEMALKAQMESVSSSLTELTSRLGELTQRLNILIETKNRNAELEYDVLTKINGQI